MRVEPKGHQKNGKKFEKHFGSDLQLNSSGIEEKKEEER